MKFKPGDKVVCVNPYEGRMKKGQIFTFDKDDPYDEECIHLVEMPDEGFYATRFELAEQKPQNKVSQLPF